MSIIKNGDINFGIFSNQKPQNYYISSNYVLTGEKFLFDLKNPIILNGNPNFVLKKYIIDFGDGTKQELEPGNVIQHSYPSPGVYSISYDAEYNINGDTVKYSYTVDSSIFVKEKWDYYNQLSIRFNDEIVLSLPYTLNEIFIQPNEWGVSDIFNTSITRLQECLDYLSAKTQTVNTYSPTLFSGWLGNYSGTAASIIRWVTPSYNSFYLKKSDIAKGTGKSCFKNISDAVDKNYYLYTIDDSKFRVFQNIAEPNEVVFSNTDRLSGFLIKPVALDVDDTGKIVYICDQISNNVYKLNIEVDNGNITASNINIQVFVGGFGGAKDHNLFNNPSKIVYKNNNVYVLDYNNFCVKQYDKNLNWLYTYENDVFLKDRPISIAALSNGLLYILTQNYNVYVYDNLTNVVFEKFSVDYIKDDSELLQICFNYNEDFFFILTEQNIFKFSLTGSYVSTFNVPKPSTVKYINIKTSIDGTVYVSSKNCIFKFQDVLQVYKLGGGLPYSYWSLDQLIVQKNEFISDFVYNRCLVRLAQNIKVFRDTLNAKFIIANESTQTNVVTYFSYLPIDLEVEKLIFYNDIENETLGVGVNELHIPSVLNKELEKIYVALQQLADFLSIQSYTVNNEKCLKSFCWSWNAVSCYNLSLPVIRTCGVNPITFTELEMVKNKISNYAPSTLWNQASSDCCKKKV